MNVVAEGTRALNARMGRAIQILLVEDSPSDRAMTIEALREGRILNELHLAEDGEIAMQFLRRQGKYAHMPRPDLIILDLNLPKMDGREVLVEIKGDPELQLIPVVVLTTSAADNDVMDMYRMRASSYITKPVGFEPFLAAVRGIEDFWLSLVRLPSA